MKRTSILASTAAFSLLSVVLIQACSGDDEEPDQGPPAGQGGQVAGVGGSAPAQGGTGGTANAPTAGTSGTSEGQGGNAMLGQGGNVQSPAGQGGTGGAAPAQGGTGGTAPAQGGTGGAPPAVTACVTPPSPSDGVSCTVTCNDDCGVHNLGARVCSCPGAEACDPGQTAPCYDCASCEYTANANHPLLQPPTAALPNCALADDPQEDATGCTENDRCQSLDDVDRFCGCLMGEWSCDSKPDNFTF